MRKPVNGVWMGLKKYDRALELWKMVAYLNEYPNSKKIYAAWKKCTRGYAPVSTNPASSVYGIIAKKQPK